MRWARTAAEESQERAMRTALQFSSRSGKTARPPSARMQPHLNRQSRSVRPSSGSRWRCS